MSDLIFDIRLTESPVDPAERERLLQAPRFGHTFTDHMVTIAYDADRGWHDAQVRPVEPIPLHPATAALHYAQEVFEGLKAHRRTDDEVALFRPWSHAQRFNRSLQRMAMPALPEADFVRALHTLVAVDANWVPRGMGKGLYLRPFMFATDTALGAGKPSKSYLFVVLASPTASSFGAGRNPISVWLSQNYVRAAAGGTGEAKAGANYAGALLGLQEAAEHGCDQAIWLDAQERRWIEEAGAMNLFFVSGTGTTATLFTPELTGTFLPGITRDSILQIAPTLGMSVATGRISIEDWRNQAESGDLTEVFACGTAAIVVNIGTVRSEDGEWQIGNGAAVENSATELLRATLLGIQHGTHPDPFGWIDIVDTGSPTRPGAHDEEPAHVNHR